MNNYSNYVVADADGRCVFVRVADGFKDAQAAAVEMAKQVGLTEPTAVYKDVHILKCDARVFSKNPEEHGELIEILQGRVEFNQLPRQKVWP